MTSFALQMALQAIATSDPAIAAFAAADAPRLDRFMAFLLEALPRHDQQQAVRFCQRVLNQQSLVMKRDAHGLRDGWLTPEDRVRLAQQEADWTILGLLARTAFTVLFASPAESAMQGNPLPLLAGDHHHPAEGSAQEPWLFDMDRLAELIAAADTLVVQWETGDTTGTPLAQRHVAVQALLEVLAERSDAERPGALQGLRRGYAGALVRAERNGVLQATANQMLDPAPVLERLTSRPWEPASLLLLQYAAALQQGVPTEAKPLVWQGYGAAMLEESLVSPLGAGR